MTAGGGGLYPAPSRARRPPASCSSTSRAWTRWGVRSYVSGRGADSRALYKVEDGQAATDGLHNFRIIMTPADATAMHQPANVHEQRPRAAPRSSTTSRRSIYDVGVRTQGQRAGTPEAARVGFYVYFQPDALLFRVAPTVGIDRSERNGRRPAGTLIHEAINHAGDFIGMLMTWSKWWRKFSPTRVQLCSSSHDVRRRTVRELHLETRGKSSLFESAGLLSDHHRQRNT